MARRELQAVPDAARLELEFDQPYLLGPLFGDYDRHLITIENRLGVHISARGNRVQIEGDADSASRARDVLTGLYNRLDSGQDVDAEAVEAVLGMRRNARADAGHALLQPQDPSAHVPLVSFPRFVAIDVDANERLTGQGADERIAFPLREQVP